MSLASSFPAIRPALLLDFANAKTLDPRVTFTRASSAVYYDDDTMAKAEENLLLQSQDFDNAAWFKLNSTITANTAVAPDGTTTAETLNEGTTAAVGHYINTSFAISANTTYAASVFAKNVDGQYVYITVRGASGNIAYAVFDISAGTVSTSAALGTGFSVTSTSITSVGSGWYRCVLVAQVGANISSNNIQIGMSDGSAVSGSGFPVYTGTNRTIQLWGAQVEQRSAVTAYTPTTTAPITNYVPVLLTAASGVPRFDRNPVTRESLGLLIEESRTNLLTRSDDFGNATWLKVRSSITSNTLVAPDGALTGDKLVEDTTSNSHYLYFNEVTIAANTAHTFSVYLKAGERAFAAIELSNGSGTSSACVGVNLTTGAVGTGFARGTASSISATSTSVGNGWWRVSITCVVDNSSTTADCIIYSATSVISSGFPGYTGDGYSGIFIWGAQLEAGSFATSYIQTVASQVTRSTDQASMTGTNFSSWYNNAEGTFYANFVTSWSAALPYTVGVLGANSANERINYIPAGSSGISSFDGTTVRSLTSSVLNINARVATSLIAATNQVSGTSNGASVNTGSFSKTGVLSVFNIGNLSTSGGNAFSGTFKKIAYYPQRLTNAQLQALTA
jgi:hypothetical protein